MKKITDYLLLLGLLFVLQSCSKDDEPKNITAEMLSGEWYVTNIRGWEYDSDASNGKSEFNETFNYNNQGKPVGDNAAYSQKLLFTEKEYNQDTGIYVITVTNYVWAPYSKEWVYYDFGTVQLKGNQLVDGTLKVSITKITDTTMTTYQKDEDGETYVTYIRL